MRWERLFEDLEAEADAAEDAEHEADVAERTRAARARLRLVDRLRGSLGRPLVLRVLGTGRVEGSARAVGADWVLVTGPDGSDQVVRLPAILELTGLASTSVEPGSESKVSAATTLAAVLRRLARDRTRVSLELVDGSVATGIVELAGADLVEVAEHTVDGGFRPGGVVRRTVPLSAIAVVRER